MDPATSRTTAGAEPRDTAGRAAARWSANALLISAGVLLVGGAIWYARSATVPLIVAALIGTQLLPLIAWATRRGHPEIAELLKQHGAR